MIMRKGKKKWEENYNCFTLLPGESFQDAGQGRGNQDQTQNFPELRRFRWDTGKANVTRVQKAMYWIEELFTETELQGVCLKSLAEY